MRLADTAKEGKQVIRSKDVFWKIIGVLLTAVLVAFIGAIGTLIFLAFGALLAWLTPMSLFQGTIVTIGSTLTMMVGVYFGSIGQRRSYREYEDADEEEDDDDDWMAENDWFDHPSTHPSAPKISRNGPCPCGSGKKYKKCCGEAA
jgi:hypothetical protein